MAQDAGAPTRRIGQLEDGAAARVEGVVRSAVEPLRSALLERPCVYWDVRRGLGHEPERREASWFWLEDETGKILVRTDALEVDVRASRAKEILETVSADHQALSDSLARLKQQLKGATGEEAKRVRAKQRELAAVVTYLLAVRAQAKGKIHLGGSTLDQQRRWIERNAPRTRPGEAARTIELTVDRYEVVLADGDRVVAEGVIATEPVPAGLATGGGYREQPTARILGPGRDGVVRVVGVGASRPVRSVPREGEPPADPSPWRPPPGVAAGGAFERRVLAGVTLLGMVALGAWYLLTH
ncbi:MAG: hypothetical protein H6719_20935 [Sandaracinaceae bacterium]|nr:hypothetical protein [Sandaracinaceae bacterium]